jgi:hypothetical protein
MTTAEIEQLAQRMTLAELTDLIRRVADRHFAQPWKYCSIILTHGDDVPPTRLVILPSEPVSE